MKLNEVRLVGRSAIMRHLEEDLDRAARSDAKILITGETGSGKEVVARLIHQRSARSAQRLVTLNCAGLPDSLLESELFGHVRGSFTGAYRDKPGLLESANNGTVFLDEVGEMSMRMQALLLRFLETGEIQRVGAHETHSRVNVRLITATNRDLQTQITSGAFREDLYFRLNVIRLHVPPLRERVEDIPLLMTYYLDLYASVHQVPVGQVAPEALDALMSYRWPGNVRELRNLVERVVLKTAGRPITHAELPSDIVRSAALAPVMPPSTGHATEVRTPQASHLAGLMLQHGESFWAAVYPKFMSRDLTRADLRAVIQVGLEITNGNYRMLVELFNMPTADYKRFLSFLRKHDCHLPFQRFRTVPARLGPTGHVFDGRDALGRAVAKEA
jgi:transcriptional regulator with GAF, ATPase, and Fis domain